MEFFKKRYSRILYFFDFKIVAFLLLAQGCAINTYSQVIAEALPGCLPISNKVGIQCGGGLSSAFEINSFGQFVVNNIDGAVCCSSGGDGNSYFEFEAIDISCFNSVDIRMDHSSRIEGAMEVFENDSAVPILSCTNTLIDNSHDQIVFTYSLDGNPFLIGLYKSGTTVLDFTGTWSQTGLSGNSLVIRVYASNKADHEFFFFENLVVTGNQTPPDAGSNFTTCSMNAIPLQGTGPGTWSGGLGSFSNVNDPNSTYTPHPSEMNSTVTLTYQGCQSSGSCSYQLLSDMVNISFVPLIANSFVISECANSASNYNLNQHNTTVNSSENVTWYNGNPENGGAAILSASNVDLTTLSSLWALVDNGSGCQSTVQITMNIEPSPEAAIGNSLGICQQSCDPSLNVLGIYLSGGAAPYDLQFSVSIPGLPSITSPLMSFYNGESIQICSTNSGSGFTSSTQNVLYVPEQYVGSFTINLLQGVDAQGCPMNITSASSTVSIIAIPSISDPLIVDVCFEQFTYYDLTIHNTQVHGSHAIQWYDGNPNNGNIIANPRFADLTGVDLWVSATDASTGCTNNLNVQEPEVEPGPAVTFASGDDKDLCLGECKTFNLQISTLGSVSVGYYVNFSNIAIINSSTSFFNFDGTMLSIGQNELTVCLEDTTPQQYFEVSTNTLYIDDSAISGGVSELEIRSISDLEGCVGEIGAIPIVTFNFAGSIDANDAILTGCSTDGNGMAVFDLRQLDEEINGGTTSIVQYFLDSSASTAIPDPTYFESDNTTIYAQVVDGLCVSQLVDVGLFVIETISYVAPDNISTCMEYELPMINTAGQNSINPRYFDQPQGQGNAYSEGTTITESGTYYIFDPLYGICQNDPSFEIQIFKEYSSGPDLTVDWVCEGLEINLEAYIPNADTVGVFLDQEKEEISNIFDTSGKLGELFIFYHFVDNQEPCQDRESQITINVVPGISAGTDTLAQICAADLIDLQTFVSSDATQGGTFNDIDGTGSLNGSTFNADGIGAGIYDFSYVVGGQSCPVDSAILKIEIIAVPEINISNSVQACDYYELVAITGTALSGNQAYYSMPNAGGVQIEDHSIMESDTTIYVYDTNGICSEEQIIDIHIFTTPVAGQDSTIVACDRYDLPLDLGQVLSTMDMSGTWSEFSNTGVNLSDISMLDISSFRDIDMIFQYVLSNNICADTTFINVIWEDAPEVGTDAFITECNNDMNYNLDSLIGLHSPLGQWSQYSGTSVVFDDSTSVDLTMFDAGSYTFHYVLPRENYCPADTSWLDITILPSASAGIDTMGIACEGSLISLEKYVTGDAGGVFLEADTQDEIAQAMFDTTGKSGQSFDFLYVVASENASCPSDTALIQIEVVNQLMAGIAVPDISLCEGEVVDLFDLLTDESSGGQFNILSGEGMIDGSQFIVPENPNTNVTQIQYEIGDGVLCNIQVENIEIQILTTPELSISALDGDLCEGSCAYFTVYFQALPPIDYALAFSSDDGQQSMINLSASTATQSLQICNNSGVMELAGGLGQLGNATGIWTIEATSIADANCSDSDNNVQVTFDPNGGLIELDLNPTICKNDSVVVNGTVYDINNPIGTEMITTSLACDTLYIVDLQFITLSISQVDGLFCLDDRLMIGDEIFDINRPSGEAILLGQSQAGCDSMVMVEMEFYAEVTSTIEGLFCPDDFVMVGSERFDISRPNGSVPYVDQAFNNCDSTVIINMSFYPLAVGNIDGYFCADASIQVGTEIFNASQSSGMVTLPGMAQGGCDSTVVVDMLFYPELVGTFANTYCSGYELSLGDQVFDIDMPTGLTTLSGAALGGCDSMVMVDLVFVSESYNNYKETVCSDFEIDFNNINYNFQNPIGQDTIFGGNSVGCDSILSVELEFYPVATSVLEPILCPGEEYVIHGTVFNESNSSGQVQLMGVSSNACDSIINVELNYEDVMIDVTTDKVIESGATQINLTISGAYNSISWDPDYDLSCNDCINPIANPDSTTIYTAWIDYGVSGCMISISQEVFIADIVPSSFRSRIYIPNVFSPNGDGSNDRFAIFAGDSSVVLSSIQVYNRWGELLYSAEGGRFQDRYMQWDGTINGESIPDGVYVYRIEVADSNTDRAEVLIGDIMVVR